MIREAIGIAFEKQSGDIRRQIEAQQAYLMEQQTFHMQTISKQLENLNQRVTMLQERGAVQAMFLDGCEENKGEDVDEPTPPRKARLREPSPRPRAETGTGPRQAQGDQPPREETAEKTLEAAETTPKRQMSPAIQTLTSTDFKSDQNMKHLRVTIVQCEGLRNADTFGKSDPYCICNFAKKENDETTEITTPVIDDDLNPKWNFTGTIADYDAGDSLKFQVLDKDMTGEPEVLGEVVLEGSQIQIQQSGGENVLGGFEGDLELLNAGAGYNPKLRVKIEVVKGPPPRSFEFASNKKFDPNNSTSLDEQADAQEELDAIMHALSKIPYPKLRDRVIRVAHWFHGLREPERDSALAKFEESSPLLVTSLAVVFADQIATVFATNFAASHPDQDTPAIYATLEQLFLAFFALELILKFYVHRSFFFFGETWKMNTLDLFLVVYGAVNAFGLDLSFLRALRVFKMAKVIRMFQALRAVRDLRVMMDCLIGSFFTMCWGCVMIFFLLYMFALVFVQAFNDYLRNNASTIEKDFSDEIGYRFGSVQDGILTLFFVVSGTYDWSDMYAMLNQVGPFGASVCIFFILLFTMSIWNIIGSIYVEKVMAMAEPTQRELMDKQRLQHKVDAAEIREFFLSADKDASGVLSEREFEKIIMNGKLAEFMGVRDLEIQDLADSTSLFRLAQNYDLLRAQHHGLTKAPCQEDEATIDGIVNTCLKVKGGGKRFDNAVLRNEMQKGFFMVQQVIGQILAVLDSRDVRL
jgi:hypothetical protein